MSKECRKIVDQRPESLPSKSIFSPSTGHSEAKGDMALPAPSPSAFPPGLILVLSRSFLKYFPDKVPLGHRFGS